MYNYKLTQVATYKILGTQTLFFMKHVSLFVEVL